MQTTLLDTNIDFKDHVFRNIVKPNSTDVFSDLSNRPEDWKKADDMTHPNVMRHHAIEFIFNLPSWQPSRFSDGSFPVWYGSLQLETTFHETHFRWRNLLSDAGYLTHKTPLMHARTVFQTLCVGLLIDVRAKFNTFPSLVQKDITHYQETQALGLRLFKEGCSGLLSTSARFIHGTNMIVFKKMILQDATYYNDYNYIITPENLNQTQVFTPSGELVCVL